MESFTHTASSKPLPWPASKKWALAGVVGSGNLEVLIEPNPASPEKVDFSVSTSIPGFRESWTAALTDFSAHYPIGGTRFSLNDQGAPPVVIKMRLRQALDHLKNS